MREAQLQGDRVKQLHGDRSNVSPNPGCLDQNLPITDLVPKALAKAKKAAFGCPDTDSQTDRDTQTDRDRSNVCRIQPVRTEICRYLTWPRKPGPRISTSCFWLTSWSPTKNPTATRCGWLAGYDRDRSNVCPILPVRTKNLPISDLAPKALTGAALLTSLNVDERGAASG
jgi:hypothetical protein